MNALDRLVARCNEMDITEQLEWLGDANMPYQAAAELEQLRQENEAFKVALEFYANPDNWHEDDWGVMGVIDPPEYGEAGKIARAALAKRER